MRNKIRRDLYDLEIKNSLRGLTQTHQIPVARKTIARINTAITQKTQEVQK
ncbi:MAG: 50S ribosomal protein L29 [Candidatus Peribacteria bacterium]|nr:MAG: 50S ribosomal protein L29 [Candidatus Peribacteria bacterium]